MDGGFLENAISRTTHGNICPILGTSGVINVFQRCAVIERIAADGGYAVRDGNACQIVAASECTVADASNAARDGNAGQSCAVLERTVADEGHTIQNDNVCQIVTATKR